MIRSRSIRWVGQVALMKSMIKRAGLTKNLKDLSVMGSEKNIFSRVHVIKAVMMQ
jgi:hypothetical protein